MPFGNAMRGAMGVGNAGRAAMGNVNPNPGMRGRPQFGMAGGPGKMRPQGPPQQEYQAQQFGQDYGGGLGPSAGAAAQLAQKMSQPRIRSERDLGMKPPSVGGNQYMPQAPGNEMAPRPMPGMKMGMPWQQGGPPGLQREPNPDEAMYGQGPMRQLHNQMLGRAKNMGGVQRGLGPQFGDGAMQALQGMGGLYR